MFLRGFVGKRFFIKIILISITFIIFLIGITRRTSNQGNVTKSKENVSLSHVSRRGSTSAYPFRQTCDIVVRSRGGKIPLAHRFPHIIIIGFGKAGTRALYQMISMHPDVVGPYNEVRFFSNDEKYKRLGIHSYTRLMPVTTSTERTIVKSPDYIIKQVAAERLKKALNHCHRKHEIKFIVVLREPFQRAVSEYLHWKLHLQHIGKKLKDFEKLAIKKTGDVNNILAQVNTSIYSYHIRKWLKVFDIKTMCFVDGDNLVKDPYSVVKNLEKCLELRDFIEPKHFYFNKTKGYYCPVDVKGNPRCLDSRKGRTHPIIDKDVKLKLKIFFQPYNEELYEMTGINFKWT